MTLDKKDRIHGLKQVSKIAHEDLKTHLAPHRCKPIKFAQGLWMHVPLNVTFALIVDNFGVKLTNIWQAYHLINSLKTKYELPID